MNLLPHDETPTPHILRSMVLVSGMTTMATEMSASRLLAPYFGASVMVWANIIGLILIYLSIGYWYGGRLADRYPTLRALCTITLTASIMIAIVPFIARPVLEISSGGIDSLEVSSVLGSFAGCLLLFSVPITFLGMVPPFTVRLALRSIHDSGQVAGSLYALSTVGSIVGTFGSVLVLIPWIGTRSTMLTFAAILALLSVIGLSGRIRVAAAFAGVIMAAAVLLPAGLVKQATAGTVVFEDESRYQFVQVVKGPHARMLLYINEGWAVHSVYDPRTVLTGGVWDAFLVPPALTGTQQFSGRESARPLRMLLIGNAGGTVARQFAQFRPHVHIDGVELDPTVSKAGRTFFGMRASENTNLRVIHADGRPFLAHAANTKWDVIHIDAFRQPYIPFYLTTREFFTLVREHLAPGGVVSINVGTVPDDDRINVAIASTMRSVFPTVIRWPVARNNEVEVAIAEPMGAREIEQRLRGSDLARVPELEEVFGAAASSFELVDPQTDKVLTDDLAPVEWLTDQMIIEEAS